ncbi:type II secretion system F family protein [Streptomyces sp. NPDC003077]|uniref:type II secretion system F family protein n=1 Tax=Streptomyces sp. NPDC003077 TaxID=3154443 RepID=UPI0033BE8407
MPLGSLPVWAAVLCAGAAVWLLGGGDGGTRRARLLLAGGEAGTPPGAPGPLGAGWPPWWRRARAWAGELRGAGAGRWLWGLPLVLGAGIGLVGRSVLPVVFGAAAMVWAWRRLRVRERERGRERVAGAVIELCDAVAGELRAGRLPGQALGAGVTSGFGEAGAAVLAAARFGGDVPRALRAAARLPGAEGLAGVAACWQVAVEGGAGLASGLERVASGLRAQRDQQDELRAQLAGPRATALMLALLPVGGLLLGSALGADPLRILLHTPAGWACLVVGGLLEAAGLAWTARIVAGALPVGVREAVPTGGGSSPPMSSVAAGLWRPVHGAEAAWPGEPDDVPCTDTACGVNADER